MSEHAPSPQSAADRRAVESRHSRCALCEAPLQQLFVDLGSSPLCQKHVTPEELLTAEPRYPLRVVVCERCFLVQLETRVAPAHLYADGEYAYFTSFSDSALAHAQAYVAQITAALGLNARTRVVEVASNDGYLLQYFVRLGVPALGIDPAPNAAAAARAKGVSTRIGFLGRELADAVVSEWGQADLIIANNVLAHVPDLHDFVAGLRRLLRPGGTLTVEFPELRRLVEGLMFDTIYHEHCAYLSFTVAEEIFRRHELTVFDVEAVSPHGGSLRLYVRHVGDSTRPVHARVLAARARESRLGMDRLDYYLAFGERVAAARDQIAAFFARAAEQGKVVAGYGAPGKATTLLNYCGIGSDQLAYTVDRNPAKQGNYVPGCRIPIFAPEQIWRTRPDYVFVLPWNLKHEIMSQLAGIAEWGARFVVPIPELEVF